jgi:NAD(P)-dependent dehydrogenase (short-subunit alcohol dehydrogenase family)
VADAIGGTFHEVDVTDFAATEQVLQQAVEALGGLHIAVTTAGGGIAERTIKKDGPHSLDSFRQSVDLNLTAADPRDGDAGRGRGKRRRRRRHPR